MTLKPDLLAEFRARPGLRTKVRWLQNPADYLRPLVFDTRAQRFAPDAGVQLPAQLSASLPFRTTDVSQVGLLGDRLVVSKPEPSRHKRRP